MILTIQYFFSNGFFIYCNYFVVQSIFFSESDTIKMQCCNLPLVYLFIFLKLNWNRIEFVLAWHECKTRINPILSLQFLAFGATYPSMMMFKRNHCTKFNEKVIELLAATTMAFLFQFIEMFTVNSKQLWSSIVWYLYDLGWL